MSTKPSPKDLIRLGVSDGGILGAEGTLQVDCSGGNVFSAFMIGDCVFNISSLYPGETLSLLVIQDGAGNHAVSFTGEAIENLADIDLAPQLAADRSTTYLFLGVDSETVRLVSTEPGAGGGGGGGAGELPLKTLTSGNETLAISRGQNWLAPQNLLISNVTKTLDTVGAKQGDQQIITRNDLSPFVLTVADGGDSGKNFGLNAPGTVTFTYVDAIVNGTPVRRWIVLDATLVAGVKTINLADFPGALPDDGTHTIDSTDAIQSWLDALSYPGIHHLHGLLPGVTYCFSRPLQLSGDGSNGGSVFIEGEGGTNHAGSGSVLLYIGPELDGVALTMTGCTGSVLSRISVNANNLAKAPFHQTVSIITTSSPTGLVFTSNTVTRDTGSWLVDGFVVGMQCRFRGCGVNGVASTIIAIDEAGFIATFVGNPFAPLTVAAGGAMSSGDRSSENVTFLECEFLLPWDSATGIFEASPFRMGPEDGPNDVAFSVFSNCRFIVGKFSDLSSVADCFFAVQGNNVKDHSFYNCTFSGGHNGAYITETNGTWLFENCSFQGNNAYYIRANGIVGFVLVNGGNADGTGACFIYGQALFRLQSVQWRGTSVTQEGIAASAGIMFNESPNITADGCSFFNFRMNRSITNVDTATGIITLGPGLAPQPPLGYDEPPTVGDQVFLYNTVSEDQLPQDGVRAILHNLAFYFQDVVDLGSDIFTCRFSRSPFPGDPSITSYLSAGSGVNSIYTPCAVIAQNASFTNCTFSYATDHPFIVLANPNGSDLLSTQYRDGTTHASIVSSIHVQNCRGGPVGQVNLRDYTSGFGEASCLFALVKGPYPTDSFGKLGFTGYSMRRKNCITYNFTSARYSGSTSFIAEFFASVPPGALISNLRIETVEDWAAPGLTELTLDITVDPATDGLAQTGDIFPTTSVMHQGLWGLKPSEIGIKLRDVALGGAAIGGQFTQSNALWTMRFDWKLTGAECVALTAGKINIYFDLDISPNPDLVMLEACNRYGGNLN